MAEKNGRPLRKRKRKKIWFLLSFLFVVAVVVCGYFYKEQKTALAQEENVLTAGENQRILFGQITDIVGNEMKLLPGEYKEENGRGFFTAGSGEIEYQIPVGTQVETKLGAVTTFSRLATGDVVEILLEEDGADGCILKMQILQ